MSNTETKVKAPYCPMCKSEGPFHIGIIERNFYIWDGEEWESQDEEPVSEGQPYDVTCDSCMWTWQAEPWD